MKTREEVEALKKEWLEDDSWDIEDTEGFEEYRDELYILRLETELKWYKKERSRLIVRYQNFISVCHDILGIKKFEYALEKIERIIDLKN